MITSIRATVIAVGAGFVSCELGGLGVRVEVPAGARAPKVHEGQVAHLHTAFIVREDSMTLYGFESEADLEVFHTLLTVSGVGPRSALGVLSGLSAAEVARAVSQENAKAFLSVSGIGPKTAKLITVSLAGKLLHLASADTGTREPVAEVTGLVEQVTQGLVALGWSEKVAGDAVAAAIVAVSAAEGQVDGGAELKGEGAQAAVARQLEPRELMRLALASLQTTKSKI